LDLNFCGLSENFCGLSVNCIFSGSRKEREGTAQRALKEIGFKLLRGFSENFLRPLRELYFFYLHRELSFFWPLLETVARSYLKKA
jgi:hypothetical protein